VTRLPAWRTIHTPAIAYRFCFTVSSRSCPVTSSLNDSQVSYWEPAKWVAKLRATKTDTNPLFFKINMAGGHGGSSGRYDRLHESAFRYAFMLDALGQAGPAALVQ
jgi:protease II